MSTPDPNWIVSECASCSTIFKFGAEAIEAPACPTCGTVLEMESAPEKANPQPARTNLISNLGVQRPDVPLIDSSRIKSTKDDDLVSAAEERIRIKRKSKRVEKQLTNWDTDADDDFPDSDRSRRLDRREPVWMKVGKIIMIAIVPVGLVILTIYGVVASLKDKEVTVNEAEPNLAEIARASLSHLEAETLDRDKAQALYTRTRQVAENFMNAPNWKERLQYVREPERVEPLMRKYYADPENVDEPFPHTALPEVGKAIVYQSLILIGVETEDQGLMPIALEETTDHKTCLVDWESFVGYSEISWNEFPKLRPTTPFLLRAKVTNRPYYNYGFQDDAWTSWQLEDRRGNHRAFGYLKKGDPLEKTLAQYTAGVKRGSYVLLRVRFPEDAPAGDQLEIVEVVAKGWVSPSAP